MLEVRHPIKTNGEDCFEKNTMYSFVFGVNVIFCILQA